MPTLFKESTIQYFTHWAISSCIAEVMWLNVFSSSLSGIGVTRENEVWSLNMAKNLIDIPPKQKLFLF